MIGDLQLDGADISVVRAATGELNWTRFASQALDVTAAPSKPTSEVSTKPPTPLAFTLKHAALNGGRTDVVDETVSFGQEIINSRPRRAHSATHPTRAVQFALPPT